MINKVIIIGRLGRDPEIRYTQTGKPVVNFPIACSEKRGGQEYTEWVKVVAWDKLAEICNQYLSKGQLVFISGRMQTRQILGRDGVESKYTEIHAAEMKMLGERREQGGGQPQTQRHEGGKPQQQPLYSGGDNSRHNPPGYDDVPF